METETIKKIPTYSFWWLVEMKLRNQPLLIGQNVLWLVLHTYLSISRNIKRNIKHINVTHFRVIVWCWFKFAAAFLPFSPLVGLQLPELHSVDLSITEKVIRSIWSKATKTEAALCHNVSHLKELNKNLGKIYIKYKITVVIYVYFRPPVGPPPA